MSSSFRLIRLSIATYARPLPTLHLTASSRIPTATTNRTKDEATSHLSSSPTSKAHKPRFDSLNPLPLHQCHPLKQAQNADSNSRRMLGGRGRRNTIPTLSYHPRGSRPTRKYDCHLKAATDESTPFTRTVHRATTTEEKGGVDGEGPRQAIGSRFAHR
ncbi:hypothetical protein BT69DRAFT_1285035 [Atractiella rhizophila]|nr:hypothetical protein BT69DRAFT_1285035 [Atractiella rhizophila]